MEFSNALLGKIILFITLAVFSYVVVWLTILPFTDFEKDHWFYKGFLDTSYLFMFTSGFGLIFIGSLMIFTLYHVLK